MKQPMKQRVMGTVLAAALAVTALGGVLAAVTRDRGGADAPESAASGGLEDMAADLTPAEEKQYAAYLNMPCPQGLEIHFWLDDGETVGTIRPLSVDGAGAPDANARKNSLPVIAMRKILRRYPNTRKVVRSWEGLDDRQLNEAKGICVLQ